MISEEEWQISGKWRDDEDADFILSSHVTESGTVWCTLSCSVHGNLVTSVTWDLGDLNVAVERHYIMKHMREEGK